MNDTFTPKIDRPFKVYVGEGWDDDDHRVIISVSKVEIEKNSPEQLEALLGCRMMVALVDLGIALREAKEASK